MSSAGVYSRIRFLRGSVRARLALMIGALLLADCRDVNLTAPRKSAGDGVQRALSASGVAPVEVFIHAAPEGWQIFMGNRAVVSLQQATKVVFIYTTAGDAGGATAFWQMRETASRASIDVIIGSGAWTCAAQTVDGHSIRRCTKGKVVEYYMRMPDGNNVDGTGYGKGSLSKLRDIGGSQAAVNSSTTYTSWADFTTTLRDLVERETVGLPATDVQVHAPEYDRAINPDDHPDNFVTADAVKDATVARTWFMAWYTDYHAKDLPVNLSTAEHDLKQQVFLAYDNRMVAAGYGSEAADPDVQAWLWRTYYRGTQVVPPPPVTPPAAPTALQAQPFSTSRIDLQWTDNATDETGFRIERAPDAAGTAGTYAEIATVNANVSTYSDVGRSANTKYWYRVRAYNAGGTSAFTPAASATTPASAGLPYSVNLYIHAVAEDWQLFMGDRAVTSLQQGIKTVFVHLTAGDGGGTAAYWQARERGSLASVDSIIGAGAWSCSATTINSHAIWRCAKSSAVSYYLRMPDGNLDGLGFGRGSLARLRDNGTPTAAIDGSTTYSSWSDLTATLRMLIDVESDGQSAPYVQVHAPDYDRALNTGDHADNFATADALKAAMTGRTWTMAWYVDYQSSNLAINLTTAQHNLKQKVFLAYDRVVVAAGYGSDASDPTVQAWLWRTYSRMSSSAPPAAPVPPSGLLAQTGSTARIDLHWTDNAADELGYRIERAPDAAGVAGAFVQIASVSANATSYSNLGLAANTKYWYRVRAYNDGGSSAYSNVVSATTLATLALPFRTDVYIHAHEDDWQLFMSDRTYDSFLNAGQLLFIYTTAGDAGGTTAFWQARENAAMAAVDSIIGAGTWACANQTIGTHAIRRCTKSNVVSYFMRMPDGNFNTGLGYGKGSLAILRDQGTATAAINNSTTYTSWSDFTTTVRSIIDVETQSQSSPYVQVHAPEYDRVINPGDHPDHLATADALRSAASARVWNLFWYVDYHTKNLAANLSNEQHALKSKIFLAYDNKMVAAGYPAEGGGADYQAWQWRTYYRTTGTVATAERGAPMLQQLVTTAGTELGPWLGRRLPADRSRTLDRMNAPPDIATAGVQ